MKVFVRISNGNTLSLDVNITDCVESLKQQIQNKVGILPEQQFLTYTALYLNNGYTLEHYEIQNEDTLYLDIILPRNIKIYIKDLSMETLEMDVRSIDRIFLIKQAILREKNIPLDEQCLRCEGAILEDNHTMKDYNINGEATFHFSRVPGKCIKVNIKMLSMGVFSLDIKPSDTIESVKQHIQNKEGVLPYEQLLMFEGRGLEDGYTLQDYKVQNGDELSIFSIHQEQ